MITLPRPLWAVNAGTAVSHRTRRDAGNSVNVIRTSTAAPRSFSLEHWTFSPPNAAFVRTAELHLG
jgi:hypothetical protein